MKVVYVIMLSAFVFTSCKNTDSSGSVVDSKQATIDSMKVVNEKERIIDSMKLEASKVEEQKQNEVEVVHSK